MKIIKYNLCTKVNISTDAEPNWVDTLTPVEIECPTQVVFDNNYPIAEKEAVGEITVEGEFDPEPVVEPTADEVLNAMLGVM